MRIGGIRLVLPWVDTGKFAKLGGLSRGEEGGSDSFEGDFGE